MANQKFTSRTQWAEYSVDDFLSLPLVAEFVYRSPKMDDGNRREVADFLITFGPPGILISQKCQDDPTSRTSEKLGLWAQKAAKKGVAQLIGALRTGAAQPMWCEHHRRGRVDFPKGLPQIAHGVVLIETFEPVVLADCDLPLEYSGVPISYFSLNDFLNIAFELRTLREITEYLDRRRALPFSDLRTIGEERSLYSFYLLNDGTFAGCVGIADAKIAVAAQATRFAAIRASKLASDRHGCLIEYVADQLATGHPRYADGLPAEFLDRFDGPNNRQNYLEMQRIFADLRLHERVALGKAFNSAMDEHLVDGFAFKVAYLDSRPEFVYLLGASRGEVRQQVLARLEPMMRAAMAHFGKSRCLAVIDRDGESFEVALSRPGFAATITDRTLGDKIFGVLRIEDHELKFASGS